MINLPYYPIINHFIEKYNYESYLELGVRKRESTYNHIQCISKEGVDINSASNPTYTMSTDEFFENHSNNRLWDIIFIDACHEKDFVARDFENSLKHLNNNGTIIMDDVNPFTEMYLSSQYCWNAWEVFGKLRGTRSDLEMYTINSSFCGVVRRGKQKIHNLNIQSSWGFLEKNRQTLLNTITWEEVLKK